MKEFKEELLLQKPTEKNDPEFEKRLNVLREKSREINKKLEGQFQEHDLPYSTKANHQKAFRISIQLRPPFKPTDEDKTKNRFKGTPDQVTFFLHLSDDDFLKSIRLNYTQKGMNSFASTMFDPETQKQLGISLDHTDPDSIVNYCITQLKRNPYTKLFNQAFKIKTPEEAKNYFCEDEQFFFSDHLIIKNLFIGTLNSIFENIINKEEFKSITDFKKQLEQTTKTLLDLKIKSYGGQDPDIISIHDIIKKTTKKNDDESVDQIIGNVIKKYLKKYKSQK